MGFENSESLEETNIKMRNPKFIIMPKILNILPLIVDLITSCIKVFPEIKIGPTLMPINTERIIAI